MYLLGYSIAFSFIAVAFVFGIKVLIRFLKKNPLIEKDDLIHYAFSFVFVALVSLSLTLIIILAFGGITFANAMYYLAFSNLALALINPYRFYKNLKNKAVFAKENRAKTIRSFYLVILLLLEIFAFNSRAYKTNVVPSSFAMSDSSIKVTSGLLKDDKLYSDNQCLSFEIGAKDNVGKSLTLNFVDTESMSLTVNIQSYKNGIFVNEYTYTVNPVVQEHNQLGLKDDGATYYSVKIVYDNTVRINSGDYSGEKFSFVLSSVVLNQNNYFHFSPLRFSLLALLGIIIIGLPNYTKTYAEESKNVTKKCRIGIIVFGFVFFLGALIYVFINSKTCLNDYPFKNNLGDYDMYSQLFDAFMKGQVNIDLPVGDGAIKYWDHAYYNNKVYVYFGALPVLITSMPLYAIFQKVPNATGLEILGYAIYIPFLFLLVNELIGAFDKKVKWQTVLFALFAVFFTSLSIMIITYKSYWMGDNQAAHNLVSEANYHVPLIYGLAFMDAYIFLALLGYQYEKLRKYFFPLSGLAFVFMVASRPNLALSIIIAFPLFLFPLIQNFKNVKKNLLDFLPMFAILFLGAFFILKYNKDRFGSYFEFGARYQYTVSDMTNMGLKANALIPGFLHYFFNPFSVNGNTSFPFIYCTNPNFTSNLKDYSTYLNGGIGIMMIPAFWMMLLTPFSHVNGEDKGLHLFRQMFLPGLIIFTMVSYALAGLCPRYLIEPYHLASLGALVGFISYTRKYEKTIGNQIYFFATAIIIGLFLVMNINFDPFDGLGASDLNGLMLRIREIFNDFNTVFK